MTSTKGDVVKKALNSIGLLFVQFDIFNADEMKLKMTKYDIGLQESVSLFVKYFKAPNDNKELAEYVMLELQGLRLKLQVFGGQMAPGEAASALKLASLSETDRASFVGKLVPEIQAILSIL
jgi:hypothetical protein